MTDTLKALFSWRGAICESELAPAARHVALTLSLHMNERGGSAFPGPALLAQETGLHVSTVKEKLGELEAKGWLRCIARGGMRGGKRCANEYEATFPLPVAVGDPSPEPTGSQDRGDPSPQPRLPVAVGDPSSSLSSSLSSLPREPSLDDGFAEWYHGYPKAGEKARAQANYRARRRQGIRHADLCAARDNYARSVADREPRYVKSAAVFLQDQEGPWSEYVGGIPAHAGSGRGNLGAVAAVLGGAT